MSADARLVLQHDPAKVARLDRLTPTTIGRSQGNRLRLVSLGGVADHHAVVRFSRTQGWLVCDWKSEDGTFLEGERVRQCRRLSDGDEIQLGSKGPVLVFRLGVTSQNVVVEGPGPARGSAVTAAPLTLDGKTIPLDQIRSAQVRSRPRHPHSFSWWVLACLGGTVLLPFPWLFWSLEIGALAAWIVLGSRKEHDLVLTLRDGMAHRHGFANRITALSHRNGIRKAIGQSLDNS